MLLFLLLPFEIVQTLLKLLSFLDEIYLSIAKLLTICGTLLLLRRLHLLSECLARILNHFRLLPVRLLVKLATVVLGLRHQLLVQVVVALVLELLRLWRLAFLDVDGGARIRGIVLTLSTRILI